MAILRPNSINIAWIMVNTLSSGFLKKISLLPTTAAKNLLELPHFA